MGLKDLTYKPRTASDRIILDDDIRAHLEAVQVAYKRGRDADKNAEELSSKIPELESALADAEAAADEAAVTFTCKALPRRQWDELVAACPPSSEDLARQYLAWDYDKFAPRLIGASLVEPESSVDEVVEMWEQGEWSDAIWTRLWNLAFGVNQEVSTRPTYGIGSAKTQASDPESTTQLPTVSPIRSSQAG
jgi:hypothetical protein